MKFPTSFLAVISLYEPLLSDHKRKTCVLLKNGRAETKLNLSHGVRIILEYVFFLGRVFSTQMKDICCSMSQES